MKPKKSKQYPHVVGHDPTKCVLKLPHDGYCVPPTDACKRVRVVVEP